MHGVHHADIVLGLHSAAHCKHGLLGLHCTHNVVSKRRATGSFIKKVSTVFSIFHSINTKTRMSSTDLLYLEKITRIGGRYVHKQFRGLSKPNSTDSSIYFQAPFIPFLTEYFYQNLKKVMKGNGTDDINTKSVHFLMLPRPE